VSIIGRGRMLAEGRVSDILNAAGERYARVRVEDAVRAAELLEAAGFLVQRSGRELQVMSGRGPLDTAEITRVLAERGLYVRELTPVQRDLESVFLELTADEHLGASGTRSPRPGPPPADWGGS
jgi:ABC-type multidrug transport system ATPase subunit